MVENTGCMIIFLKIEQLKGELKQKELEMKQGKFQIESLELENKYLKSKNKEHERYMYVSSNVQTYTFTCRSRRKIGSRLDKVNDILSSSIPTADQPSFPLPLSSSTPSKVNPHY